MAATTPNHPAVASMSSSVTHVVTHAVGMQLRCLEGAAEPGVRNPLAAVCGLFGVGAARAERGTKPATARARAGAGATDTAQKLHYVASVPTVIAKAEEDGRVGLLTPGERVDRMEGPHGVSMHEKGTTRPLVFAEVPPTSYLGRVDQRKARGAGAGCTFSGRQAAKDEQRMVIAPPGMHTFVARAAKPSDDQAVWERLAAAVPLVPMHCVRVMRLPAEVVRDRLPDRPSDPVLHEGVHLPEEFGMGGWAGQTVVLARVEAADALQTALSAAHAAGLVAFPTQEPTATGLRWQRVQVNLLGPNMKPRAVGKAREALKQPQAAEQARAALAAISAALGVTGSPAPPERRTEVAKALPHTILLDPASPGSSHRCMKRWMDLAVPVALALWIVCGECGKAFGEAAALARATYPEVLANYVAVVLHVAQYDASEVHDPEALEEAVSAAFVYNGISLGKNSPLQEVARRAFYTVSFSVTATAAEKADAMEALKALAAYGIAVTRLNHYTPRGKAKRKITTQWMLYAPWQCE